MSCISQNVKSKILIKLFFPQIWNILWIISKLKININFYLDGLIKISLTLKCVMKFKNYMVFFFSFGAFSEPLCHAYVW